jgi:L-malate glycosyltransferase
VCLNYINEKSKKIIYDSDLDVVANFYYLGNRQDVVDLLIDTTDVVILHYWNFPLLLDFLLTTHFNLCHFVTWSHSSGLDLPYVIPNKLIDMSDRVVFTSAISQYAENIRQYKDTSKFITIRSTGDIKTFSNVCKKEHDYFNILYVGTLDFSKLSSDFVSICKKISDSIPEVHFIICGDGASRMILEQQISSYGIQSKFMFTGFVSDIKPYLSISDLFLYPLQKNHFGTGEIVLSEAMATGVVPVVFDNFAEKEIVIENLTGKIAKSGEDCIKAVVYLYENKEIRKRLSDNAKEYAIKNESIEFMITQWHTLLSNLCIDKKERCFIESTNKDSGINAFVEALGNNGELFKQYFELDQKIKKVFNSNSQWSSKSKGSVYQYLEYFPNNHYLQNLKSILERV